MIKAEMSNKPLVCVAMLLVQTLEEYSLVIAENVIQILMCITNVLELYVHSLIILINLFKSKLIHYFPLDKACLECMSQRVVG